MCEQAVEKRGPLMTETVEGKPIRVGQRELVPVVRVTTAVRRRALLGTEGLAGQGCGFVHMRPVGILERGPGSDRRISIPDKTAQGLCRLVLIGCVIPLLLVLAVGLARKVSAP